MSAYPVWCFTFSYSQHPFQRPTLQPICHAQSAQCFDSALPWIARTGQMDSRRGPPRHGTVRNGSDFHQFQKRWLAICKSANRLLVPEPHVRSQWGLRAARIREAVVSGPRCRVSGCDDRAQNILSVHESMRRHRASRWKGNGSLESETRMGGCR
jgi:hypothetical protein